MSAFDLIVLGGGISGVMAAVSASRQGVKTLLIERYGFLGGMLTAASVGPMMSFHAGPTQVVKGLPDELIERMKRVGDSTGHIYDTTTYTATVTPFDYEGMKYALETMALESGVTILYNGELIACIVKNAKIESVEIATRGGLKQFHAKAFIDATGDAVLAHLAGAPTIVGRESDHKNMPMTMNFRMCGVDVVKVKDYIRTHPESFPELKGDTSRLEDAPRLSIGGFTAFLEHAQHLGEVSFEREKLLFFETNTPGHVLVNTTRVAHHDPLDPFSLSDAETIGRKQVREIVKVMVKKVPGFESAKLTFSGPQIGVRSSRRIVGAFVLNETDLLDCVRFSDTIAHGGYPIDIHAPEGHDKYVDWSKVKRHLPFGAYYDIPLRALIPQSIDNLLAVGKALSCTFEAFGSIRVSPIAGATGHAGGCAAASFLANRFSAMKDLDASDVRFRLRSQDAFLRP
jgi:hypothetical protein